MRSDAFGADCIFEGDEAPFADVGFTLCVLRPGQPNGMYHRETNQEDFLVLSGECLLIVEGEERRLRAWDFVHCPADAAHVIVGAGDGPCVFLAVGARKPGLTVDYPVNETALRHGAGVERQTSKPNEAYARFDRPVTGPYRKGDLPSGSARP